MINNIPYSGIQSFTYQPRKSGYPESKARLKNLIAKWMSDNDPEFKKNPRWICNECFAFWSVPTVDGKETIWDRKERQQKRKGRSVSIGGALATTRKIHQYDKRWKTEAPQEKVYKPLQKKEGQMAGFETIYQNKNFHLNGRHDTEK